jgi:uncharacterized protein YdiU (UPF0061 family)
MLILPFTHSYAALPAQMHAAADPTPVAAPQLLALNLPLARELRLDPDWLASPEGVAMLAGNATPPGVRALAMAYAGHQFGHFVPSLGDGRALLLGEVVDRAGQRRDVQLKGSGPTPFSRRGDGRAALGPVLREYLVAEAMAALGVPTSRALAAVATGEEVYRETPLPGAILTRVAASHIRVGTFQYFAARRDMQALRALADHAIARHDPAAQGPRDLFAGVVARQAALVAQWLCLGFVHGVMNTDNCTISGETIDYGPCAFLDAYDPQAVFSSIDHGGRYAYGQQPRILAWNLARLAEAMLPLFDADETAALAIAQAELDRFGDIFEAAYHAGLLRKIGIAEGREGDMALVQDLLTRMAEGAMDFTNLFRGLLTAPDPALGAWLPRWRARLAEEADPIGVMRAANPAVIPRNHRIEQVIQAAMAGDLDPFRALLDAVTNPYADPSDPAFTRPPEPGERVRATFCGT